MTLEVKTITGNTKLLKEYLQQGNYQTIYSEWVDYEEDGYSTYAMMASSEPVAIFCVRKVSGATKIALLEVGRFYRKQHYAACAIMTLFDQLQRLTVPTGQKPQNRVIRTSATVIGSVCTGMDGFWKHLGAAVSGGQFKLTGSQFNSYLAGDTGFAQAAPTNTFGR